MTSCFSNSWTEKQRKEFEIKCALTDTFYNISFQFKGFGNNEFDSILVKEFKEKVLLDSFNVFVRPGKSLSDKEGKKRSAIIERTMNTMYTYYFMIPKQKPYEFKNMKMIMWPQYTMTSEGWGCVMGSYTIDGKRFENNENPVFIKRTNNNEK